jgi:hypothetical protein
MNDIIRRILETGIQAPSGENSQPWRFVVRSEEEIELWNVPERDLSLYNVGQEGSYVAHGALIENIVIAASKFGYRVQVELFPEKDKEKFVAKLIFTTSNTHTDVLYDAIYKRATNRKAYATGSLTSEQKSEFLSSAHEAGFGEVKLVEGFNEKESVAFAASANDEMVLANRSIHNFFFSHVRWNKKESDALPNGFYVDTLELAPPQLLGFKMFRRWSVARLFNKLIGIAKLVAAENAKVFMHSAAMGVVTVPSATPENFVKGGRLIQRIWLKATHMGLSFQPLVGGSYLELGIRSNGAKHFTEAQIHRITEAHKKLKHVFGIANGEIAMVFRVGKGGEPSARSPRFPLSYFIESTT